VAGSQDTDSLRQLAVHGFAETGATQLRDLSHWCQNRCDESGDGRFCILAQVFLNIFEWWDERGDSRGVPRALLEQLEVAIRRMVPIILDSQKPAEAAKFAAELREQVGGLLLPEDSWGPWVYQG
jgi:hypothetical protein